MLGLVKRIVFTANLSVKLFEVIFAGLQNRSEELVV